MHATVRIWSVSFPVSGCLMWHRIHSKLNSHQSHGHKIDFPRVCQIANSKKQQLPHNNKRTKKNWIARYQIQMKMKRRQQRRRRKESKFKRKRIIAQTHTRTQAHILSFSHVCSICRNELLGEHTTTGIHMPLPSDERKIAICSFSRSKRFVDYLFFSFSLSSYFAFHLPLIRLILPTSVPHHTHHNISKMCMLLTFVCRILANRKILYRI